MGEKRLPVSLDAEALIESYEPCCCNAEAGVLKSLVRCRLGTAQEELQNALIR